MSLVQPFNPGDVNIAPNNRDGLSHKINMLSAVDFNSFVPLNFPPTGSLGLVPALNDTYDIGTTALRWRTGYLNDLLVETIVADDELTIASLNNVTIQSTQGHMDITSLSATKDINLTSARDINITSADDVVVNASSGGLDINTLDSITIDVSNGNVTVNSSGNQYFSGPIIELDCTTLQVDGNIIPDPVTPGAQDIGGAGSTWRNIYATTFNGALSGNATTATTLATARNINGVSFNGSADVTVPAAAGTLTGSTLAAGVTASSLTSVATLGSLTVTGATTTGSVVTPSIVTASNADLNIIPNGTGDLWFSKMNSLSLTLGVDKTVSDSTNTDIDWANGGTPYQIQTGDSLAWSAGTPSRITINKTGFYMVNLQMVWAAGVTTGLRRADLYINGTGGTAYVMMGRESGFTPTTFRNINGTRLLSLSSGDYLEVQVYANTGGSSTTLYGKNMSTSSIDANGSTISIYHISL
jgi:hypothetical protein